MATDLDSVARCRFEDRCGRMDSRRRTTLSGVVVASWHGTCNSTALKMDLWQVAAAASYPAGVLVEECAGLVGAPYPAGVLVGTSGLRCLGLAAMSVWY